MKDEIIKAIAAARMAHPKSSAVKSVCDTLEDQLEINEANLTIKKNLANSLDQEQQKSALLQREIDRLRLAPPETTNSFAQQRLQALVTELQQPLQELNTLNEGVPPLSPECLRQHAAIGALQGLLTNPEQGGTKSDIARYAVNYADALVQELAK